MVRPCEFDPEELLAMAKAGDAEALGRLVQRHRNYLLVLARMQAGRLPAGKLDDQDLVQEACLAAHRGIEKFRGRSEPEFRSWLRSILASVLADQVRRYRGTLRRDLRLERGLADGIDRSSEALDRGLVSPESSPSHRASRREQAILLADALGRLPDEYREVIVLRQLEGLRFSEVALRMGRSEDSVKNLWIRALGRMRRAMGVDG